MDFELTEFQTDLAEGVRRAAGVAVLTLAGDQICAGISVSGIAGRRQLGIELLQGHAQHRRTLQEDHRRRGRTGSMPAHAGLDRFGDDRS